MESSFPKRNKRQSKESKFAMPIPMPSSETMFWKSGLHKDVHTYTYILMWKAFFQNIRLVMVMASPFLEMALIAFWGGEKTFIFISIGKTWMLLWLKQKRIGNTNFKVEVEQLYEIQLNALNCHRNKSRDTKPTKTNI